MHFLYTNLSEINIYSSIIGEGSAPLAGECTLDYDVIIENNGCAQACHVLCHEHVISVWSGPGSGNKKNLKNF